MKDWMPPNLQIFLKTIYSMKIHLFRNLPFPILALLLAVSFWFFLVIFQNIIYDLAEPVEIEALNAPSGLEVASPLPDIMIRVTAPKDDTAFLNAEDFKAEINLEGLKAGEYKLPVRVSTEMKNVNIVSYIPQGVEVVLEEMSTKSFAVRVNLTGQAAPDHVQGAVYSTPEKVGVKGPVSLMESIAYVGHEVELTGTETANIKQTYTLTAYDEDGLTMDYGLTIAPETVVTEVEFIRAVIEKPLPISVQFAADVDTTRINEVITSPHSVVVRGGVDDLAVIGYIKTAPLTAKDIEAILTGGEFFPQLIIPENVTLPDGEPEVTVEIKQS